MSRLTHDNHDRDSAGLTYVYPVLSRRSKGLSIGINLNPNNACNWACLYCQVPNLQRGSAPPVDTLKLKDELTSLLRDHASGLLARKFELSEEELIVRDIAISGNGEPTSCPNFLEAIEAVTEVAESFCLLQPVKKVVITNGSLMEHPEVQKGLIFWGRVGGEVWFKLDRGTTEGIAELNQTRISMPRVRRNLEICASLLPTWIQTCLVTLDGETPGHEDIEGYLRLLSEVKAAELKLQGVLLYGLARPSLQPDAHRVGRPSPEWSEHVAKRISELGLEVRTHL